VLNRTQLIDRHYREPVATHLAEGRAARHFVLFVLLRASRAALVTALRSIPVTIRVTPPHLQGKIAANLMSLGALDFGFIVDGAVIIAENSFDISPSRHEFRRALSLTTASTRQPKSATG